MARFRTSGRNWEGREWFLAPSLVVLAHQIESVHPDPKPGDGTVASRRHDEVSPSSDHRPRPFTGKGVVRAIDAGESQDADPMVTTLVASRDPRIAYIIYERTIWRSYPKPGIPAWTPAAYTGPAPHSGHFHLSTLRDSDADNDTRPWTIVEEPQIMSLPINADSHKEEIRHVQEMLGVPASGDWDFPQALEALRDRSGTGDDRDHVNGRMYTHLLEEFIRRHASGGGLTESQVKAIVNGSQIVAPD